MDYSNPVNRYFVIETISTSEILNIFSLASSCHLNLVKTLCLNFSILAQKLVICMIFFFVLWLFKEQVPCSLPVLLDVILLSERGGRVWHFWALLFRAMWRNHYFHFNFMQINCTFVKVKRRVVLILVEIRPIQILQIHVIYYHACIMHWGLAILLLKYSRYAHQRSLQSAISSPPDSWK